MYVATADINDGVLPQTAPDMDIASHISALVTSSSAAAGHPDAEDDDARQIHEALVAATRGATTGQSRAVKASRLDAPEGVSTLDLGNHEASVWDSILSDAQASTSRYSGGASFAVNGRAEQEAQVQPQVLQESKPHALEDLIEYAQAVSGGEQAFYDSIISNAVDILGRAGTSDDEASALLAETLGFDQLELVTSLVGQRREVVCASRNSIGSGVGQGTFADSLDPDAEIDAGNSRSNDGHSHRNAPRPYIPGSSVVVQTKGDIEEAKRRRAEQRRLHKGRGLADRLQNHDQELTAEEMAVLRAQSLQEASQRPLFTSDRTTANEPKYPHVFTSNTGGNILSAFGARFALPPGTARLDHDFYEEVTIPPPRQLPMRSNERPIPISEMDVMARGAFPGYKTLNRLQSVVYPLGYGSNENLLVCAPTGAGKTDVAMLTVLRAIRQHARSPEGVVGGTSNGKSSASNTFGIHYDDFKIIYVAPMKALASEIVGKFSKRLRYLGVRVRELTGDMQMTRQEIDETQMIVTTPEKWDVVTRKPTGEGELASKVKLLIIDEVHLLHEERGAVIETIVARTLRLVESSQSLIRIVGLSATLPNYIDVADFLRVNRYKGLFYFDSSFRPVPLEQHFLGVKGKINSPAGRQNMEKATFEKLQALVEQGHQVMIFVHARKETVKTAYAMRDMCRDEGMLDLLSTARDQGKPDLFRRDIMESRNRELKELFETGFGIHHAGMLRKDRNLSERLFSSGATRVLCCTSTLAWGVNLPAYAVLIKGTDIYDSSLGKFSDLSILDVLQIFGRAGRPQYESVGVGYIITSNDKLSHYVDAITTQHPIESKFNSGLIDALNAEVALGSVNSVADGITWLSYTYLFTRMRRNPLAYGMLAEEVVEDPQLGAKRLNEISRAAKYLSGCKMLEIDDVNGQLTITELGRIAARYYISYKTIEIFEEKLKAEMSEADLLGVFGHAIDFAQIIPRETEIPELKKLQEKVPCEIANACDTSAGKANLLLQVYISRHYIDDFALVSDSAYVAQNAGRVMRALFEIALSKRWAITAAALLGLTRAVERRMWPFDHPLGQSNLRADMVHQVSHWGGEVEVKDLARMSTSDIGTLCHINARHAEAIRDASRRFPYLGITHALRPLLHDVLRVDLAIEAQFEWEKVDKSKSLAESFYIWVEDEEGKEVLQSKRVVLRESSNKVSHLTYVICLPNVEATSGVMIRWISERWLGSEDAHFADFSDLKMPERGAARTALLDLPLLSTERCCRRLGPVSDRFSETFKTLNALQSQCFHAIVHSEKSVILAAPNRSGRTTLAQMAAWRHLKDTSEPGHTVICIYPTIKLARRAWILFRDTAQYEPDTRHFLATDSTAFTSLDGTSSAVAFTTPPAIDSAMEKNLFSSSDVRLIIAEDLHLMHSLYELTMSRLLFLTSTLKTRWLVTSASIESLSAVESWLSPRNVISFNFDIKDRVIPLKTAVVPFDLQHSVHLLRSMVKPAYDRMKTCLRQDDAKAIIFVPSQSQCFSTSRDLVRQAASDGEPVSFMGAQSTAYDFSSLLRSVDDRRISEGLTSGVGIITSGMHSRERRVITTLFESGAIRVLVTDRENCWSLDNISSQLVIIMGVRAVQEDAEAVILEKILPQSQKSRAKGPRHKFQHSEYEAGTILQMQAMAMPTIAASSPAECFVFCQAEEAAQLRRVLDIGAVLESDLLDGSDGALGTPPFSKDEAITLWYVLRELSAGRCSSRDHLLAILDWTFARQRLQRNPCYYGGTGTSASDTNSHLSNVLDTMMQKLTDMRCVSSACLSQNGSNRTDHAPTYRPNEIQITALGRAAAENASFPAALRVVIRQYRAVPDEMAEALMQAKAFQVYSFDLSDNAAGEAVLEATRSCVPSETLARFGIRRPEKSPKAQTKDPGKVSMKENPSNNSVEQNLREGKEMEGGDAEPIVAKLTGGEQKALLLAIFLTPQCEIRTSKEAAALQSKNRKAGKSIPDLMNSAQGPSKDIIAGESKAQTELQQAMFALLASIVQP